MLSEKTIQKVFRIIASYKASLPVCRYSLLSERSIMNTDLDYSLVIETAPHEIPCPALVDTPLYIKTGNLITAAGTMSYYDRENIKDYPGFPAIEGITIQPEILKCLSALSPVCDGMASIPPLKYIHVNKKGEAVSCNGHILFVLKTGMSPKIPFMISPKTLKIITALSTHVRSFTVGKKYLFIGGDGWDLAVKTFKPSEYPHYKKVIPSYTHAGITWSKTMQESIVGYLKEIRAYLPRNGMVYFTDNESVVKNKYLRIENQLYPYFRRQPFEKPLFNLAGKVIAVNAFLLLKVLSFITDNVIVKNGPLSISALLFSSKDRYAVLMPLRTGYTNHEQMINPEQEG